MSLPSNWASASILTCGTFIRGVTYKKQEASTTKKPGYTRLLRANNISNRNINTEEIVYVPLHNISETQILQSGDILIATSSGSPSVVGKAAQIKNDTDMSFGAFCGVLRPYKNLNPEYIGHFFSSKQYRDRISKLARGTNINNIKQEHFESIKIPIAPINEQRRIADKLDRVLARVDAANEHLSRVAPLIKRFRQSVLAAATSGRLTEDWRKHDEYQTATVRMDEIGKVSGGLTKNTKRAELPLRKAYLRVANVYPNEVRLEDVLEIGLTESEYEKTKLTYGDLLIVEGNGSIDQIGRVAMWKDELPECSHQNHLIRWRRSNLNIAPEFILAYLMSPAGRKQIISAAGSTSGLHTLSVSKISALELNIPPLEEQTEIVRRVEKLFAFADRLEERLSQAQAAVQKLTPALLAKAFRGELVPQDPNDEPASELLKRLQENRTDSANPSRARKPHTRKSP